MVISERTQRILWTTVALTALVLAAATACLCHESGLRSALAPRSAYRVVHMAASLLSLQIHSFDELSQTSTPLRSTEGLDSFPSAWPGNTEGGQSAGQLCSCPVTRVAGPWEILSGRDDYVMQASGSPDGRYVAHTLYAGRGNRPIPDANLMLIDLATRLTRALTDEPGLEGFATWIRDSEQ